MRRDDVAKLLQERGGWWRAFQVERALGGSSGNAGIILGALYSRRQVERRPVPGGHAGFEYVWTGPEA